MRNALLSVSIVAALLAGCSGGGGVKQPPPPPVQTPQTCNDPTARNFGGPAPCIPRYRGPNDIHQVALNADLAHRRGLTGQGVTIGIMELDPPQPGHYLYPAIEGRFELLGDYRDIDPNVQHATFVAAVAAGRPWQHFVGGTAPDARLIFVDQSPTPAMAQIMAQRGVRILNGSFGSVYRPGDIPDGMYRAYALMAMQYGFLMVFAAGNAGAANAAFPASLPAVNVPDWNPAFHDQWLAVTGGAVDFGTGQIVDIDPDSNRCGVAAQWCVVAPYRQGGFDDGGHLLGGTSLATASVSGVAALVLQAYPWMTGSNLQQTILTTARDMGEPGVDSVFGWGVVDADRATRGPAQFIRTFEANIPSGTYRFEHAIAGPGGLVLRGAGELELMGQNTYAGPTDVQGGTLILSGSIAGNVVNRASFRALGGRIGGNYTALGDGAVTEVRVGAPLTVGGTAQLDGLLRLLAPASGYVVQARETVLTAGQVQGRFDAAQAGSGLFYSIALEYTPQSVLANLTRTSAKEALLRAGAADREVMVGGWIDAIRDEMDARALAGGDDAMLAELGRLFAMDEASAKEALGLMAGDMLGGSRVASIEQTLVDADQLADRAARAGAEPGLWIALTGRDARMRNGRIADFEVSGSGVMVGADRPLGDGVLGAALSGSDIEGRSSEGRFEADRVGLALYGSHPLGAWKLSGQIGWDRVDADVERRSALSDPLRSSRTDHAVHGRVELSRALGAWEPYVALGAVEHRMGGFAEEGGALGLSAAADRNTLVHAEAGGRFRYAMEGGGELAGRISVRHAMSGRDAAYRARLGDAQTSILVEGQPLDATVIRVGAGYTSAAFGGGWRWFADAGVDATSDGTRNVTATAGLRLEF